MSKIIILNYHQLIDGSTGAKGGGFSISKLNFEAQILSVLELGIPIISLEDACKGKTTHECSVLLTFDDGYKSDYEIVYPFLSRLNVPATFFPFIEAIGTGNRLNWKEIQEMTDNGFTIGSHGMAHKDLRGLSYNEQKYELKVSKQEIENVLGKPVNCFSFPFGGYTDEIVKLTQDMGYEYCFSTKGFVGKSTEKILLHRWNIKATTSMMSFEKILLQKRSTQIRKKSLSMIKSCMEKIVGRKLSRSLLTKISAH